MKPIKTILVLAAALLSLSAVVGSAAGAAATREFEGTVVSVNREAKTFRLHDAERGTVRIKVTRHTRFERIGGLAGLRAGAKNVEATVKRKKGAWVALSVERSGGGGERGGGGGDDDPAGDDHGGR